MPRASTVAPAAALLLLFSTVTAHAELPPAPRMQSTASARGPAPEWRVVANNLLVFRWNPLGLQDDLRLGLQKKLYESDKLALRDNFIHVGIYPRLNPAFVKIGPSFEIQPASVFNLRVAMEYMGFFSSFGFLQSFATPSVDYSDTTLSRRRDEGLNYATQGVHVMIEPFVQFKVGPIAVRDRFAIEYWNMKLRGSDTVWYEATLDTLVPRDGWVLTNDLDVLYTLPKYRLNLGVRYSLVKPLYKDTDFLPSEATDNQNGHHRLGLIAAYTFFDHGYSRFEKPTVLLISSWYLQHRWRTGADVSPAVPYLIVGFAFQSDLLQ